MGRVDVGEENQEEIESRGESYETCGVLTGDICVQENSIIKTKTPLRGGPIKQYIVLGNGMISVMLFFRFVSHRVMRWEVYRCSCS